MTTHSEIFEQLRDIIAEETGNDPASITPDSDLIEDLGMVIEHDLPPVIKRINKEFAVALNPKLLVVTAETVNDLLTYIIEEIELG
jgi:acyl carrier protein